MQYFWGCVVDCGEEEGCVATIVLLIDYPFLSPPPASGGGGGGGEVRTSFIVGGYSKIRKMLTQCFRKSLGELSPRYVVTKIWVDTSIRNSFKGGGRRAQKVGWGNKADSSK